MSEAAARLVLALPFSVVPETSCLRLVAGEDVRYTFRRREIERYGPPLIAQLRDGTTRRDALGSVAVEHRAAATQLLDRLIQERIVVRAQPEPVRETYRVAVQGAEPLCAALRAACGGAVETSDVSAGGVDPGATAPTLAVLCQDTLDYHAALRFQSAQKQRASTAWMWVTEAPRARGFVSPVFLASGGPCLGCLLTAFRRLSPAPELYDALSAHGERGGELIASGLDDGARSVLARIAALKIEGLGQAERPASTFALHVFERASLEVSVHPLAIDVDCGEHRR